MSTIFYSVISNWIRLLILAYANLIVADLTSGTLHNVNAWFCSSSIFSPILTTKKDIDPMSLS